MMNEQTLRQITSFQRTELTEYYVYNRLASRLSGHNADVLRSIGEAELRHHDFWKNYTKTDVRPRRLIVWAYLLLARIFGLTFAVKLMEQGEQVAQRNYAEVIEHIPEAAAAMADEKEHEMQLVSLIQEKKLEYMGSVVLGLNDALVELTGALAGLSFALRDTQLVALAGLVTGIAASFSMAASEYLSKKSEKDETPITAALYTGIAYIVTVALLVASFVVLDDYRIALGISLTVGVAIIAVFTFFNAVTKDEPFRRNFLEMTALSFGVALISFGVGFVLRRLFGIDV